MIRKFAALGALCVLSVAMVGCDDDDDTPAPPAPAAALSGTVAVGAALANANMVVRCSGGSVLDISTSANAQGNFTITVNQMTTANASLPCAIRATGTGAQAGTVLYSVAQANGTVNVTPLTTMVVEHAADAGGAGDATTWFGTTPGAIDFADVTGQLAASTGVVETALEGANGSAAVPFDIFATVFAAGAANPYDQWLDALGAAIDDAATAAPGYDFESFLSDFVTNGNFSSITLDLTQIGGGSVTLNTLTIEMYVGDVLANSFTSPVPVPVPAGPTAWCTDELLADTEESVGGLTISSCSFANGVGTINGTVQTERGTAAFRLVHRWSA